MKILSLTLEGVKLDINTIENKGIKVLSVFDGISCARVAIERANIPVSEYYASEIDKYATQISTKNYPDIIQVGDITKLNGENFIGIDLIIGGSPCQDLSIAKKNRDGLSGKRSGLFWEYVRIINEIKPKYFILENVNSMPKDAKKTITDTLWGIEPTMINASLVSAQNRKRLFWVGKLVGDTYEQVKIELPKDRGILLRDILEQEVDEKFYVKSNNWRVKRNTIRTSGRGNGIDDKHNLDTIRISQFNNGGQGDRIYSPDGKSVTLSANGGGRGAKTGLYTINTQIRKLTPVECERLQSLPDNYTEGVSNTQRYKMLGNAFNVDVITHILKFLFK